MRRIPEKVHQGVIVKTNSKTNGNSTRLGGSFRHLFAGALPFPRNFDMQTRFRGALRNWLKYNLVASQPPEPLPFLQGFSFNEAASLLRIFKIPLTLTQPQSGELVLRIPAFTPSEAINAPGAVTGVHLTIVAACCHLPTAMPVGKMETTLMIPYHNTIHPAQEVSLPLQMPAGSLTLVVVALRFFQNGPGNVNIIDERWLPSEVIGGVVALEP